MTMITQSDSIYTTQCEQSEVFMVADMVYTNLSITVTRWNSWPTVYCYLLNCYWTRNICGLGWSLIGTVKKLLLACLNIYMWSFWNRNTAAEIITNSHMFRGSSKHPVCTWNINGSDLLHLLQVIKVQSTLQSSDWMAINKNTAQLPFDFTPVVRCCHRCSELHLNVVRIWVNCNIDSMSKWTTIGYKENILNFEHKQAPFGCKFKIIKTS